MRWICMLGLVGCASASPLSVPMVAATAPPADETPTDETREVVTVHAPALDAAVLVSAAGVPTYLEDHGLIAAEIDTAAVERWMSQPPRAASFYAEEPVEVARDVEAHGACRRVALSDAGGGIALEVWRRGAERARIELTQDGAAVLEESREGAEWRTVGMRSLAMALARWDDDSVRYARGAERYELACVQVARAVMCSDAELPPRGYCVDRELVVRPMRMPTVMHVGPVIPGYPDVAPTLPPSACEVTCEPSACEEALRTTRFPFEPLYAEDDPVLAVFRTREACRAFAHARFSRAR